jgi:hypothetical protein
MFSKKSICLFPFPGYYVSEPQEVKVGNPIKGSAKKLGGNKKRSSSRES